MGSGLRQAVTAMIAVSRRTSLMRTSISERVLAVSGGTAPGRKADRAPIVDSHSRPRSAKGHRWTTARRPTPRPLGACSMLRSFRELSSAARDPAALGRASFEPAADIVDPSSRYRWHASGKHQHEVLGRQVAAARSEG